MSECKEFIVRVRNADLIAGSPFGTPYFHGEIVRCRDCVGLVETWDGWECERFSGEYHRAEPDGFCSWGERANFATCKCGEDIETNGRESVTCPSCGRMVIA